MTEEALEGKLSYVLGRVSRVYRDFASELLAPTGLHLGQNRLLQALWRSDGLSQSELAEHMQAQLPTITRMVGRMEKTGFVERRPSPTDARTSQVFLTDRGREAKAPVNAFWAELEGHVTTGLSPAERRELQRLLWKVYGNVTEARRIQM